MTGMMAQTGSLGQPLLIPLSMAGSIGGQGGLAVLTLPTTSVAALPGLAAANPTGNLLKLPFAGLQGEALDNSPCWYCHSAFQKHNMLHSLSSSCDSVELGPAPAADKCSGGVSASSSFTAGCSAAGGFAGSTDEQHAGFHRSGRSSPGDLGQHHRLSVQHIRGSASDRRPLHQSCYCENALFYRHAVSWSPGLSVLVISSVIILFSSVLLL